MIVGGRGGGGALILLIPTKTILGITNFFTCTHIDSQLSLF